MSHLSRIPWKTAQSLHLWGVVVVPRPMPGAVGTAVRHELRDMHAAVCGCGAGCSRVAVFSRGRGRGCRGRGGQYRRDHRTLVATPLRRVRRVHAGLVGCVLGCRACGSTAVARSTYVDPSGTRISSRPGVAWPGFSYQNRCVPSSGPPYQARTASATLRDWSSRTSRTTALRNSRLHACSTSAMLSVLALWLLFTMAAST
jgi:hypothetical protein